jgi:GNAT superfamily N-acetyltransferase
MTEARASFTTCGTIPNSGEISGTIHRSGHCATISSPVAMIAVSVSALVKDDGGIATNTMIVRTETAAAGAASLPPGPPPMGRCRSGWRWTRRSSNPNAVPGTATFAAVDDGEVVGWATTELIAGSEPLDGQLRLLVRPDHRGRGIGAKLLEATHEVLRSAGATSARVFADPATSSQALAFVTAPDGFMIRAAKSCRQRHPQ